MKTNSIHSKFTSLTLWILTLTGALTLVVVYTAFTLILQERLSEVKASMKKQLISKGKTLIINNSHALEGMAEDHSFFAITQLISPTVTGDPDVSYGVFMDTSRLPWVQIGLPESTNPGKTLSDEISLWAHQQQNWGKTTITRAEKEYIEFVAPVISNKVRLGTIRYGLSTEPMKKTISIMRAKIIKQGIIGFVLFLILILGILIIGYVKASRKAQSITQPIAELTQAVEKISRRNYKNSISVQSDDEIGLLANRFEEMRITILEYTADLEQKVDLRTLELEKTQKELVDLAHKSGMADIATAVLHNIGNILNSVLISSEILNGITEESGYHGFKKANQLLRDHIDNLDDFICNNPKGKKLMRYYLALEEKLEEEFIKLRSHTVRILKKNNAIKDVIMSQQTFASGGQNLECLHVNKLIDECLVLLEGTISRHHLSIETHYGEPAEILLHRSKFMQVVLNIFKNAKEAMYQTPIDQRKVTITTEVQNDKFEISFRDTGEGIEKENLLQIFNHGFTTKEKGHGFGLHSCANFIAEMKGEILANSTGPGQGATLIIRFPILDEEKRYDS